MPVKIFFCYAHEDEPLLNKLKSQLSPLRRQGLIDVWHDRDINAGTKWEEEIDKHLNEANIILLLVSPDFMDSDYCYGKEMQRALERDQRGEVRVIPIILRPVYWQGVLGTLQALPTDAKPIMSSSWQYQDEAFFNVTEGIQVAVKDLLKDQWLAEGNTHYKAKHYDKALLAYNQVLKLDSKCVAAHIGKGDTLREQEEFDAAILAYDQAIDLDPKAFIYTAKGSAFERSGRNQEALVEYDKAVQLEPTHVMAWYNKGNILYNLKQYGEALKAYEQVGELTPDEAMFHYRKGYCLEEAHRYKEELDEAEKAIALNPKFAPNWRNKGEALRQLKEFNLALSAYEKAIELNPKYSKGYNGRGLIRFEWGEYQQALEDFERAIQLEPNYKYAWEHKGRTLEMLAKEAHEKAQQLGYKK